MTHSVWIDHILADFFIMCLVTWIVDNLIVTGQVDKVIDMIIMWSVMNYMIVMGCVITYGPKHQRTMTRNDSSA